MATKRLAKIKKDNPQLAERTDVQEVANDVDLYAALAGVASSAGGEVLMAALNRDISSVVQAITGGYKTLSDVELRALVATLDARIQLARTLNRASQNLAMSEEVLKELTG